MLLTYTATDSVGPAIDTFAVTISGPRLGALPDFSYRAGDPIPPLPLPAATATTGDTTYALTGANGANLAAVAPGLRFDPVARVLSGTPQVSTAPDAPVLLTYRVTDDVGTTSVSFGLVFTPSTPPIPPTPPAFRLASPLGDLMLPFGRPLPLTQLPAAGRGALPTTVTYRLSGSLPTGLAFDAATRTLFGTPLRADATPGNNATTPSVSTQLTYTATESGAGGGLIETVFTLTLRGPQLSVPPDIHLAAGVDVGNLILSGVNSGTNTGEPIFTLTGPNGEPPEELLPGLSFFRDVDRSFDRDRVTGTPTTPGDVRMRFTVTDDVGSDSRFRLIRVAGPSLRVPANRVYPVNQEINPVVLPVAMVPVAMMMMDSVFDDFDPPTYTLTGALPAGLTFTAATRTLSGTPTAAGASTLTYTAASVFRNPFAPRHRAGLHPRGHL